MAPDKRICISACLGLSIFTLVGVTAADAKRRGYVDRDYVVAESRFGNGKVVGAVRQTQVGLQVRTPGGNWLDCARSCSETLRVNTVDYWQSEAGAGIGNAITQEDGVFGRWLYWQRKY